MIVIRSARFADAASLASRLRVEDAIELAGAWPADPTEGLVLCLLHSDRALALCEGEVPLALCGISAARWNGLDLGVPWLLAAPPLFQRRAELARRSRAWVDRLLLDVDVLTNLTDASNASHLRWLSWCGFDWLRDHASHGRLGRRYREFYRLNVRRCNSPDSVREQLLRRAPGSPRALPEPAAALIRLATPLLGGDGARSASLVALLRDLPQRLDELDRAALAPRTRCGLLRLLAELAPGLIDGAGAAAGRGGAARGWCEHLLELAGVLTLAGPPADVGEVAAALENRGRERPRRPSRPPEPALQQLAHRYHRALTLGGRVEPVQGYRLRAAASGIDERATRRPLGVCREEMARAFASRALAADVGAAVDGDPLPPGLLCTPVVGPWADRLRRAAPAGSSIDRALAATAGRWGRHLGANAGMADVSRVAGAMADAVALRLLPALRFGGVVFGGSERLALYRLLRGALLHSALAADHHRPLCRLLAAEVGALLVVGGLDDALLEPRVAAGVSPENALENALVAVWGRRALSAAELPTLLGLLLPVLATPVVHACQLAPALLVWHLAEADRLGELLVGLVDVFADPQSAPHRRVQRFLRVWQDGIAIVDFCHHLDANDHRGSRATGAPTPTRNDRGRG